MHGKKNSSTEIKKNISILHLKAYKSRGKQELTLKSTDIKMGKYLIYYEGKIPDILFNNKDIEELLLCSPVFQSSYGSSLLCSEKEGKRGFWSCGLLHSSAFVMMCLNFRMQNNLEK